MRRRTTQSERRATRPAPPAPEQGVLQLQRLAGNHAVSALVAREPSFGLYDDEEKAALKLINDTMRLDDAAVRTLQSQIGAPLTGRFTYMDARSLSHWRVRHGMKRGGLLSRGVLEKMLADLVAAGRQDEAVHLVANASGLLRDKDVLSLRFDPSLADASAQKTSTAQLRVLTVGPSALKDVKSLQDALKSKLSIGPAPQMSRVTPSVLTDDEADAAAAENQGVLRDRRSILAIQGVMTAPLTGTFDAVTSRFVADRQAGLPAGRKDGVVDEAFVHDAVATLAVRGAPGVVSADRDALIRLVVDFFQIDETGVADAGFDPSLVGDFEVRGGAGGTPVTLTFGPRAFGEFAPSIDPAAIVHTIARGYQDARLAQGSSSAGERKFMGAELEVLSSGMAEEKLGATHVGFIEDATEALAAFKGLSQREQRAHWEDFERVRNKFQHRLGSAPATTLTMHQQLLDEYAAVRMP